MMVNLTFLEICRIPLSQIDGEFHLTDFSLASQGNSLELSITQMGVAHPLLLVRRNGGYGIVSGHRRFRLARSLKLTDVPARVLEIMAEPDMLETNLIENVAHKQYSDVEKGLILQKFHATGLPDVQIIDQIMPLLSLEKSKKLYTDLLRVGNLPPELRLLMHALKMPLRFFSVCFRWCLEDLKAVESLLALLRPGMNKSRDLLDLLDETARCEQATIAELLARAGINAVRENDNLSSHEKYDRIFQEIHQWRHPRLSDLKKRVLLSLDKLKLSDKIKIRTAENFENGEIKVEFRFTSREELKKYADQLSAVAESEAMMELIRVFKENG